MTLRHVVITLMSVAVVSVASCQSAEPETEHVTADDSAAAVITAPDPAQKDTPPGSAQKDTPPGSPQVGTPSGSVRVDAPLTPGGWGVIRIGMTLAELTAVAGEDANPQAVGGPDPERCDEFRPTEAPDGMIVMIERGRLTRISIGARSDVKTERGFGIGDTAAEIKSAYGASATTEPHAYAAAPAEYITIWETAPPAPEARGILYDIGADGRVSHVRAGGPSIQYYEGCV